MSRDAALARVAAAGIIAVALASCSVPSAAPVLTATDNAAIQRDFDQHLSVVQATAGGTVDRLLSDQDGPSGLHERFIVRLGGTALTVLIEHNLTIAPRVPVAVGEAVVVHGEYVWNDQGGLIHFTHHDPAHTHDPGYVLYGGRRYD